MKWYRSHKLHFTSNAAELIHLEEQEQKDVISNIDKTAIYPGDYEVAKKLFMGTDGVEYGECRLRVMCADQSGYFWCLVQCKYVYDNNELSLVIGKLTDIDDIIQNETRYRQLAETDSLTGLLNRGFCEQSVNDLMLHDTEGLLFLLDMDNFKDVNDQYGHAAGDFLLKHMGTVLREHSARLILSEESAVMK